MVFPSSKPHRVPPSTTDSQYDTTTGYSSSSYTKWPRSPVKTDLYATRFAAAPATTPSSRAYQAGRRRTTYLNEPYSDILAQPPATTTMTTTTAVTSPQQQQQQQTAVPSSNYSINNSPQQPTVNYLLP